MSRFFKLCTVHHSITCHSGRCFCCHLRVENFNYSSSITCLVVRQVMPFEFRMFFIRSVFIFQLFVLLVQFGQKQEATGTPNTEYSKFVGDLKWRRKVTAMRGKFASLEKSFASTTTHFANCLPKLVLNV